MSRRSTAPLEAVVLPDLPPPRGNRWGVFLVGAAFVAVLGLIVAAVLGVGMLATSSRSTATNNRSLVDHWETPQERLANISQAMNSRQVGASAGELRDFQRLFARVASACQNGDAGAYQDCFDMNLLVRRISQHPAVRDDRNFSTWSLKNELEGGITTLSQVGEFSIVRVERSERGELALVYTVDWSPGFSTACRWWLARDGRNWRVFDWERLDYEQSLAHTWAIRNQVAIDPNSYNYTVLRGALNEGQSYPGDGNWRQNRSAGTDLASLIDDPLPDVIHEAAMFDLAWALIGRNQPAEAIRACDSLRRPQDHPGYLVIRARAQAALGRHREALADALRYQELAGRDPLALEQAAQALAQLDRFAEAADCWREMLRLAPNHSVAMNNFCRLADAAQREQIGEMFDATRQPIETAVTQAQAALYRDDVEAFKQFAEFVNRAAPGSPAAMALEARRLEYEGQHEQAAALFRQASEAEFRPDKKTQYFNEFLTAMTAAGKIAEGYGAAQDLQAAFDYLTDGYEYEESSLSDVQLKILLAEHQKRVPGDARADYLAGQLLLREEQYAAADAKFQSALANADEEQKNFYQEGRVEALYRMGRKEEAYKTLGRTPEVFRGLARHCESDGAWDELRALIVLHRAHHEEDRWIDYFEALDHRQRGEPAMALAAISRAEQDEQLKMACRWMKRAILIEAGQMDQAFTEPDERRTEFLGLASELTQAENWSQLDKLHDAQTAFLGRDAGVLNAWTDALYRQGRLAEASEALAEGGDFDRPPGRHVQEELAERHVRCLLRLNRVPEARQAAERASTELGAATPLVMVLLAEGNMAAVRERLADHSVLKPLLARTLDEDPELSPLLSHPDLADLHERLVLPIANYDRETDCRLILLLREPLELSVTELTARLTKIGAPEAAVMLVPHVPGDSRRTFRIEHEQNALLVTFGTGKYWQSGRHRRPPRDPALAKALAEHRGFVVLECNRSAHETQQRSDAVLLNLLAADLCDAGVLAIHGRRPQSSDWRLAAPNPALIAELRRGQFLSGTPKAGESFSLVDPLRYPAEEADEAAAAATNARRRAASRLARQAGKTPSAEVQVDLWRGHARETLALRVVAGKMDENGNWQLHGELLADSVLRPKLLRGMRLAVAPYEVREIREQ